FSGEFNYTLSSCCLFFIPQRSTRPNVFTEQKEIYRQLFDGYVSKPIEKHELIGMLSTLYLVNT
ncbi:MAG: hypothetical protein V7683_16730, partial [Pseudoalteromonas distincta]